MPRPRKPPRLDIRTEADGRRVWVIRDDQRYVRTGFAEVDARDAEQSLLEYLTHKKAQPDTSKRHASQVKIADILKAYLLLKVQTIARPDELRSRVARLNEFWGGKSADSIRGPLCRDFVRARGSRIAARRELETLRAACNHYAREYGLDTVPKFTLPDDSQPRERWLTRSEVARLLWSARRQRRSEHLIRFILIAVYTGTRHSAILKLQWFPNTTGGWVDLEHGILYRKAAGAKVTKKRQPPTRIPPRLLAHLRRWRAADGAVRHIVRYEGKAIGRVEKAFRGIRDHAGLPQDVKIHSLRHSRCTWLLRLGVPIWEVAGSLGMTVKMVEDVYGHHAADFQKRAAEAY